MKILVGSTNPVKIKATKLAFAKYFTNVKVEGKKVPSWVSDQPIEKETVTGAKNRVDELMKSSKADFYVGIEAGMVNFYGHWMTLNAAFIKNNNNQNGLGTSINFELPPQINAALLEGEELGPLMDRMFADHDSNKKGGAIARFTKNALTRTDIITEAVIVALIPFINPDLYKL